MPRRSMQYIFSWPDEFWVVHNAIGTNHPPGSEQAWLYIPEDHGLHVNEHDSSEPAGDTNWKNEELEVGIEQLRKV